MAAHALCSLHVPTPLKKAPSSPWLTLEKRSWTTSAFRRGMKGTQSASSASEITTFQKKERKQLTNTSCERNIQEHPQTAVAFFWTGSKIHCWVQEDFLHKASRSICDLDHKVEFVQKSCKSVTLKQHLTWDLPDFSAGKFWVTSITDYRNPSWKGDHLSPSVWGFDFSFC